MSQATQPARTVDEITVVPSPGNPVRNHWRARWLAAAGLGFAMVTIPVMAAVGVALFAALLVPPPSGPGVVVWWTVVFVVSAVAACGAQRLVRRYLPMVGLLRLALVFPADVPSRLGLAMRAGSIRELERGPIDLRNRAPDDIVDAAARVVAYASALQNHDRFTRGHCERVRAYTDLLADELGIPKREREKLRWAALLRDIGKLEVSKKLLNKPGALDEDEWVDMRKHAAAGGRLAEPLRPWLGDWVDAVGQHHERFDGGGYPRGLAGTDIALGARIVAVADSYETITAARPYKRPIPHSVARKELVAQAGADFDPEVVHAMLRLSVRRLRWAAGPLAAFGDVLASRLISSIGPRAAGTREDMRLLRIAAISSVLAATFLSPTRATSQGLPRPEAQETTVQSAGFVPVSIAVTRHAPAQPPPAAVLDDVFVQDAVEPPSANAAPVDIAGTPSTTAIPATPATPAEPAHDGQRAVPAIPATPAGPARSR